MRFGRLLPSLSVFLAAGALIVLTGTGAAATQPGRSAPAAITANLAAPAALDSYLRSIGVKRASLVTQRGARNYAGPNCPGKGWTCTTSTRVLQITADDGQNKVDCPSPGTTVGPGPSQSCEVDQVGENNSAKCHQRSDSSAAVQICDIDQTGTNNVADVHQTVYVHGSDTQATQTAVVNQTQDVDGGSNKSQVRQDVKQKAEDGSSQWQDAQQSAEVDQEALGTGTNASNVHQSQHLSAKGSAASQSQNTEDLLLPDCASGTGSPSAPNACANVWQSSGTGTNESRLKQSINEDAKTDAKTSVLLLASQLQGNSNGGLDGQIHQDTDIGGPGSSQNRVDQDKRQRMSAPAGSSQTQYDPVHCCGVDSQVGGTGNSEQIDQSSTQDASEEDAYQQIALIGESVSPDGSCSISQKATNSSDSTTNRFGLEPSCPYLLLVTTCSSGGGDFTGGEGISIEQSEGSCTASEPDTDPPPPPCDPCLEGQGVFGLSQGVFGLSQGVFAKPND